MQKLQCYLCLASGLKLVPVKNDNNEIYFNFSAKPYRNKRSKLSIAESESLCL